MVEAVRVEDSARSSLGVVVAAVVASTSPLPGDRAEEALWIWLRGDAMIPAPVLAPVMPLSGRVREVDLERNSPKGL